jgi:MFS family permease
VLRIRADDIDYEWARGGDGEKPKARKADERSRFIGEAVQRWARSLGELVRQKPVAVFLVSAVIFHFANAAMLPLVTETLGRHQGARQAVVYTAMEMTASQLVFVAMAAVSGRLAGRIGRKPLFVFAFGALAARGVLYTVSAQPFWLIAVQCLDGLGAGTFGVVSVLIIADLTRGTGRFNAAQGAVAAAQGTGAFLSNALAGALAKGFGVNAAFLVLAGIAAAGLVFFAGWMPETLGEGRDARGGLKRERGNDR